MHTQISDACRYLGSVTTAPVIHKTRETHTHDYKPHASKNLLHHMVLCKDFDVYVGVNAGNHPATGVIGTVTQVPLRKCSALWHSLQ